MNSKDITPEFQTDLLGEVIRRHYFEGHVNEVGLMIDGEEDASMSSAHFFRSRQEINEAEAVALSLCRGRVLDVGAGAGCHALILQELGFDVVAVEKSAGGCEVMRSRGVMEVLELGVMEVYAGMFDTILLLMNGFGIAGTEQGLTELLLHLKGMLAPGGKIIGDSTDIHYFKEFQSEIDLSEQSHNEVLFEIHALGKVERFPWIFPDEVLLEAIAEEIGLQFNVVMYSDEHHFLCEFYV
jgi:SAM-dependent methyltransferase